MESLAGDIYTPPAAAGWKSLWKLLPVNINSTTCCRLEESLKSPLEGEYINPTTCCRLEESLNTPLTGEFINHTTSCRLEEPLKTPLAEEFINPTSCYT